MDINWFAILAAVVANMVLGFIWYNPKVFGNAWRRSLGKSQEELMQGFNPGLTYGLMALLSAVVALGLYGVLFLVHMEDGVDGSFHTFKHGALHGAMTALPFVVPPTIINGMFERRGWASILIHCGYWVVSFALMAGVIDALTG